MSAAGKVVLVVDDEEMVRDVAEAMLEAGGYRVLTANDGVEALEVFREHDGDVAGVLLDDGMPRMDGPATLAELRTLVPDLPIILSSGHSERDAAERYAELQPTAFLRKPYTVQVLLEKIAAIFGPA